MNPPRQLSKEEMFLDRLSLFFLYAESRKGQWDDAMELLLYDLIETHQSRPRAIWRYCRHAIIEWYRMKIVANVHWYSRLWWLRYGRWKSDEEIFALFEQEEQHANQALFKAFRK